MGRNRAQDDAVLLGQRVSAHPLLEIVGDCQEPTPAVIERFAWYNRKSDELANHVEVRGGRVDLKEPDEVGHELVPPKVKVEDDHVGCEPHPVEVLWGRGDDVPRLVSPKQGFVVALHGRGVVGDVQEQLDDEVEVGSVVLS